MGKAWGNTMWPSTAKENGQPINNLPGLYLTEDWVVHYWDVAPRGDLRSRQAVIQLPYGYADACPGVRIGENGCVHNVRRWGVQCYTSILQDIGFDPFAYLSHDAEESVEGENREMVSILIHATHFCLPGHFTVASDEHPLLLFDPLGDLKGSCTHWLTHLGALAFMVSDGEVNARFLRLYGENPLLYGEAVAYLRQALLRAREEGQ